MEQLKKYLAAQGVEVVGVASYEKLLPLLPVRSAARVPQDCQSVLFCLFPYYIGPVAGRNVSRYTVVPDYHSHCGEILKGGVEVLEKAHPQNRFAWFVDASPFREVAGAWQAGLGVIGRNGQLIHLRYGSYCFIGEIATDLVLPSDVPLPGGCLDCGACLRACPTGALTGQGVDTARCRSQITQKKKELTSWEEEQIAQGGMAWGCDKCTDCCPHNQNPVLTPIQGFYHRRLETLTLDNLEEAVAHHALGYRGKGVLQRNLKILAALDRDRF